MDLESAIISLASSATRFIEALEELTRELKKANANYDQDRESSSHEDYNDKSK